MAEKLKLILPKGRIEKNVLGLLESIGIAFRVNGRSLRPSCSDPAVEGKTLKPQNIPTFVGLGRHDAGFTGRDWVVEQEADVVELLNLGFDPVRIAAAVPEEAVRSGEWRSKRIVVASEYRRLASAYIKERCLDAVFVQSFGATEALPPEDADLIIDNTATGTTLAENRLVEVDELMRSTTRFIANRRALEDPFKGRKLREMAMLMKSTLNARDRVLLEMNVPAAAFDAVVRDLPCMRSPTVAPLHNESGFAVKVAVPAEDVPSLIPTLVAAGARDILEYRLEKIVGSPECAVVYEAGVGKAVTSSAEVAS
ncbi:MAG: ATP phosphoribosyltransferase [Planctomycetota bacterium]|jgi:ATP phosphoribosyltransferase